MEVRVFGVIEEGPERLARGPLDEDHRRARLGVSLDGTIELPERHDPAAMLADRGGGAARVPTVHIILDQVEEVQSVDRRSTTPLLLGTCLYLR